MKVAFTGDRNWSDEGVVLEVIESLPRDTEFVLGDARGLDTIAAELCEEFGRSYTVEVAHWAKLGRAAGPERNGRMLDHLEPGDAVYAFHDNLAQSKGTRNCAKQAEKRGMVVITVRSS